MDTNSSRKGEFRIGPVNGAAAGCVDETIDARRFRIFQQPDVAQHIHVG